MAMNDTVTFLLVEDDDIDVRLIEEKFHEFKISNPIVRARHGAEALQILRAEGKDRLPRPYLILLDLKMPEMNGIEFLSELRNDPKLAASVVFVLTTSDEEKDKDAAYRYNVAGYLLKDEAGEELINAIRMLNLFTLSVHFPSAE
jgi:CheY-like chemotaxis protein